MANQPHAATDNRNRRSGPPVPGWVVAALGVALLLGLAYLFGPPQYRTPAFWRTFVFIRLFVFIIALIILAAILHARHGGSTYIRRIPGLTAIDETVGRATEMGRPITFSLGLGLLDIITLQALAIALHVVRLAIRFGTRVIVTTRNPTVYAVADEAINEAYTAAGRPESFNRDDVRFLSDKQFAYAAAKAGIILRERAASNYMFGQFYAESLILAEAGNQVGAIQVAGTPAITQVPFFIATCDYTIIGDEYYAATAYLTRDPVLSGSVIGQDRAKMLVLAIIVLGAVAATVLTLQGSAAAASWMTVMSDLFSKAK
ncbi:MAG TPA: DUF6754 domain-containing protein [Armatimonadota bacterium]|nr:DUF6754 domain-containing protein [Armatimonadota bacterium]